MKGVLVFAVFALAVGYADPVVATHHVASLLAPSTHTPRPHGAVLAARAPATPQAEAVAVARATTPAHVQVPARRPQASASQAAAPQPRAIAVSAGAYCLTGHTATGTRAGPGSVAVDPRVIPLGSHLFVTGYGYGYAVDTGGAVRGDVINVWMTCRAARAWGFRAATVYVLAR